MEDAGPRD